MSISIIYIYLYISIYIYIFYLCMEVSHIWVYPQIILKIAPW